jgi:carbonic anhydrase
MTEYVLCQTGTHQSPINIAQQELSTLHTPNFEGYANTAIPGNFANWQFAPSWTPHHPEGDVKGLPSFTFDGQEVFNIGWHIHAPSEHLVDGVRSRAEIHMVHVTAEEHEAAVIGIRVGVGPTESAFIKQLGPMIHYNDTSQIEGLQVNLRLAIDEVGGVQEFWTYKGSLTTPPCSEGLRWFVPKQELMVSEAQMVEILAASRFSHRVTQPVWLHDINL